MSLTLTPDRLAATYDALRAFPPFAKMGLPPSDEVEFRVTRHRDRFGHYIRAFGAHAHEIAISEANVGLFNTLAMYLAHEMIHLYQGTHKLETAGTAHNAEFRRIARQVCARFGWDFKAFI